MYQARELGITETAVVRKDKRLCLHRGVGRRTRIKRVRKYTFHQMVVEWRNLAGWARVLRRGVSIFRRMVREDCPEKVVFKQITERKGEQSCVRISRKSTPAGGSWAGSAHVRRTKKRITWLSEPRRRAQSRAERWREPGQGSMATL